MPLVNVLAEQGAMGGVSLACLFNYIHYIPSLGMNTIMSR
jgi:hypothetical protein